MKRFLALVSLALAFSAHGLEFKHPVGAITREDGKMILANREGLSAYTFDSDIEGSSRCIGQCAVIWPPILTELTELEPPFGIHTRVDSGKNQVTYKGRPLYLFIYSG